MDSNFLIILFLIVLTVLTVYVEYRNYQLLKTNENLIDRLIKVAMSKNVREYQDAVEELPEEMEGTEDSYKEVDELVDSEIEQALRG